MSFSDDHASSAAPFFGDETGEIFDAPETGALLPAGSERLVDTQSGFIVVVKRVDSRQSLSVRRRLGTPPVSSVLLTPDESLKLSRILAGPAYAEKGSRWRAAKGFEDQHVLRFEQGEANLRQRERRDVHSEDDAHGADQDDDKDWLPDQQYHLDSIGDHGMAAEDWSQCADVSDADVDANTAFFTERISAPSAYRKSAVLSSQTERKARDQRSGNLFLPLILTVVVTVVATLAIVGAVLSLEHRNCQVQSAGPAVGRR